MGKGYPVSQGSPCKLISHKQWLLHSNLKLYIKFTNIYKSRRRFCHSLPVSPDFHKRCNHKLNNLRKQKTCDHPFPKDHPTSTSSTFTVDPQISRRKARSLEAVVTSEKNIRQDNGVVITRKEISVSHAHSSSDKRDSLSDNKTDDETSRSPLCQSHDPLNTAILFPVDNIASLNPDDLFTCHREPPILTPKSIGFEPSFEDWKSLETAEETREDAEVHLTEMSPEMDEFVDSLLSDVVRAVVEREISRQQTGLEEFNTGSMHSSTDSEGIHRELNGWEILMCYVLNF